jgi:hypothetical protein
MIRLRKNAGKLVNLWPASRIDELMPWAWAAERSADKLAATPCAAALRKKSSHH